MDNRFYLDCECGCCVLSFRSEDGYVWVNYFLCAFHERQRNVWDRIKYRAKLLWNIFIGKEFMLYDIILDGKQLGKFKEFVANIDFPS